MLFLSTSRAPCTRQYFSLLLRAYPRHSIHLAPFASTSAVSSKNTSVAESYPDDLLDLERKHNQILTVVQCKINERNELWTKINSGSGSTTADSKKIKDIEALHGAWKEWLASRKALLETSTLLDDPDPSMRALAREEYNSLLNSLSFTLSHTLPPLLVPPSSTSALSAVLELKSGVGGAEASLFLADLLRMYIRFAGTLRWDAKVLSRDERDGGGLKNAIVEIAGAGVYDVLRWESGVHRVQRVPSTEASGRVHTSTVSVFVLPSSTEKSTNAEVPLFRDEDVKIEVMRARGAGGQHVNKTESAVRLTHILTGITVSMQDERSQHTNKARAFQVLRARLLHRRLAKEMDERRETRRKLVRSADRSEKVRTYNFAQDRVTDHRINLTTVGLDAVLEGPGLQQFTDALQHYYQNELIEGILDELRDE